MMTQELNVCVLAAPLAAIDRRELSQAWYSALHGSSGKSQIADRPRIGGTATEPNGAKVQRSLRERRRPAAPPANPTRQKNAKIDDRCTGREGDRRARRSALARRIERRFLDPRSASQRATFSAGGKRVHVMVQASAGRVRLVAVCPPSIRETVARALAQARFALASRGVACS